MITDVFHKRYNLYHLFGGYEQGAQRASRFFIQVCHILEDFRKHLWPDSLNNIYTNAHEKLVRELGWGRLHNESNIVDRCFMFLATPYDLWNKAHGDFDTHYAIRLSLIELLFREHEAELSEMNRRKKTGAAPIKQVIQAGIQELNIRMKEAGLRLHYHSGIIQISDDSLTTEKVREPFWEVTKADKWMNVDREMKEAIDHKDAGEADAHFHAMKSLESAIKIISDEKGLTTGKERGAANYIENLSTAKLIKAWEADMLKSMFKEIRNPAGHGSGSSLPQNLAPFEVDFIIESSMSWIKSLIRRM